MNNKIEDNTRIYYERVIDDWYEDKPEHPYAKNQSWQLRHQLLRQWVSDLNLNEGRMLEVGCGLGLLQDVVDNYIGIDIAASSQQHMKKPFAVCSATTLPFPDDSFDGVWSFWVLEHIAQPEQMLAEMRRVTKPGGSVFLVAAYDVEKWISRGIHKRAFQDMSLKERIEKLTIPVRSSVPYKIMTNLPLRLWEMISYLTRRQETDLRYGRLEPNYDTYWDYDADACVSLDSYSTALYFLSRGDRPYFSGGIVRSLIQRSQPQAYFIQKNYVYFRTS